MRRTMLATASAVLLACLGACTDDRSDAASDDVAVVPAVTPEPTPLDPFGWADVDYEDYLAAADELGLRPEVLLPMAGFSSSLNLLCHSSAEDLARMRTAQMDHTKETETYSNAKYLGDEVALRLGLACPQRMADWNAAGIDRDNSSSGEDDADDGVSAVTDADLAEAVAEEAEASRAPDYGDADADEVSTTPVSSRP